MKRLVFFVVFLTSVMLPFSAWGQDRQNYLVLKGGLYTFTGAIKEATIDTGFDGEIAVGRYLCPNFSLELGTGYFHDGVNKGFGNDIKGVPFVLTAKGLYPFKGGEVFAGGGVGFYHAQFHGKFNNMVTTTSDTVFGEHVTAGVNVDISSLFFIGIEGKYIFTNRADFDILKSRLNGHTITIDLGYRF